MKRVTLYELVRRYPCGGAVQRFDDYIWDRALQRASSLCGITLTLFKFTIPWNRS